MSDPKQNLNHDQAVKLAWDKFCETVYPKGFVNDCHENDIQCGFLAGMTSSVGLLSVIIRHSSDISTVVQHLSEVHKAIKAVVEANLKTSDQLEHAADMDEELHGSGLLECFKGMNVQEIKANSPEEAMEMIKNLIMEKIEGKKPKPSGGEIPPVNPMN